MTPEQVVKTLGGTQMRAAHRLGIHQTTLSLWRRRGYVPWLRQCEIQLLTMGELRADPSSCPDSPEAKGRGLSPAPERRKDLRNDPVE